MAASPPSISAPSLQSRQWGRTSYNFGSLESGTSATSPVLSERVRAPVQLFKALLQLTPAHFASIAMFTVWVVDSQAGQQVTNPTSQVHTTPRFHQELVSYRPKRPSCSQ